MSIIKVNKMFNYDFSVLENRYSSSYDDDYCCEYCCGEYSEWLLSNSYRRDYEINKSTRNEIVKLINVFLNDKREKYKGSYKEFTI